MSPHHGEVIIPQTLHNEPTECRTDTKATSHHPQDNGAIIHTLINAFWKTKVDRFDQTVKHIFLENNKSINALRNTSIKDLLSHIQFTPNTRQPQGYEFFLHPAINSALKEESSEATKNLLDSISDHHIIFTNEGKCASESCTHILDQISDTPKVKNLYHDALKTVGYGRPGAHHKDFEEHNCPFDPRLYFGKVLLPSLHLPSLHHVPKQSVEQNLFLNVDDISNLLEQHTMKYRMFLKSLDSEPSVTIPDDADTSFTSSNESDAMEVQFSNILRLLREDSKSDKAFNILLSEDVRTIWRQHRAKSLPPIGRPNANCMWSANDSIDLDFSFGNLNKIPPKQEVFEFDRILKAKEILDSPPCLETKHSFVTNDSCTLSLTNHDSNLSDKTINIGTDKDGTMNDEEVSRSPMAERIDVITNDSPVQTTQNDPAGGYGYSVSWSTDDCSDDMVHDDDGAAIPTIMNQGRNMLGDTAEWPLLNQNEWSEDSPIWPETSPQQQRDECNYAEQQASNVEDNECTRTCILPGMSREAPDGAPSEHKIAKQSASYTSISDPDIYQSCVQESNSKVRGYKATRMRMKEQLHKHITKDRANDMASNKVNDWKVCEAKDETVNANATEFRAPNILNIRVPVKISQAPNPQVQNLQSHFSQISNPQSQRFQGHFSHASNSHGQSSQGQYSHVPSSRSHITQGNISQFPNAKYDVLPPIDSTSHLPNDCGVSKVGLAHGVSMTDGRNDQVRVQPNRWGLWENIPNADSTKQIVNTSNVATGNQQHRFLTPVYNMNKPRQLQMPNNRQSHQQMEVNPYIIPAPPPILSQPPPLMIQQRELQQIAMLDVAPPALPPNLQHIQNPYLLPPQHNPTMVCGPRLNMPPPPPNCPPPTQWNTQLSNNLTTIRSKVPSYSSQMQHMNVIQQQQQPLPPPPPFPLVTSWAQPPLWPSARVNQDNLINIPTNKHTIDKTVQSGAADEIAPTNSKAVRSEFTSTATCSSIKEDKPKLDVNSPEFVPERMKTREELRASAKLPEITLHNSKNIQCVINEANKLLRQIYKGDSDNLDNKLEDSETPYQKLVREVLGNTKKSEDIAKVKCSPSKVKNESDIINLKADDSKPVDTTSINAPNTSELSNGNINTFQEVKTKRAFLKHIKTLKK